MEIDLKILRTNRKKTASISIIEGQVRVHVPKTVSHQWVGKLIAKKGAWIENQLRQQAQCKKHYIDGEIFSLLGKDYLLKLIPLQGTAAPARIVGNDLIVQQSPHASPTLKARLVQAQLISYYRAIAAQLLPRRTWIYAAKIGVQPKSIIVRQYKARWGSCSRKNDIRYNWKIIIAPQSIVDYVIVHELCHILEHNHSTAFWRQVEKFIPDFRARQKWLRKHEQRLVV